MKQKLFLFTNSFPYGKGEKTFIYSELQCLKQKFEITIISAATLEEKNKKNLETILENDVNVLHYGLGDVRGIEVLRYVFSFMKRSINWREVISILKSRKFFLSRLKKSLFFYASAKKFHDWLLENGVFDENNLNIYYTYWYTHITLALVLEKKEQTDMKIVTRAHGYDLYEERNSACWQPYKRIISEDLNGIFLISRHGYDYFYSRFWEKGMKINCSVCRIGTSTQELMVKENIEDIFCIVSCSNIVPVKRLDLLIEGLALLRPSDKKVIWIHYGDGPDRKECEKLARNRIVQKNVVYEFKGHTNNDEILKRYRENKPDCFIMVSSSEGSPIAMQEAISFGIPIIATAVGGIPEMVTGNGILLEANPSPQEIAIAIERMYNLENSEYVSAQERSYEIWKEEYDKDRNCRMFLEILQGIDKRVE